MSDSSTENRHFRLERRLIGAITGIEHETRRPSCAICPNQPVVERGVRGHTLQLCGECDQMLGHVS